MLSQEEMVTLVLRAQQGQGQAFEKLARGFLRQAYTTALSVVGRPADAEDVAQEALVRALEKIESCRKPESFGHWLRRIVKNESKNWLRRRRRQDVGRREDISSSYKDESLKGRGKTGGQVPYEGGKEGPQEQKALRDQLLKALDRLNPTQREVVLLHELEGLTHGEIASLLDISALMSRQHLFNARQELRAFIEGDMHPGGVRDDH